MLESISKGFYMNDCWNVCCICWRKNPDTKNCSADDINPKICKLSHLDFRYLLDLSETLKEEKT
jgi:hypothetical protein